MYALRVLHAKVAALLLLLTLPSLWVFVGAGRKSQKQCL